MVINEYSGFLIQENKSKIGKYENLIFSKRFDDVIRRFKDNDIAADLLLNYDNIKTKYTYIDTTNNDDMASYLESSYVSNNSDNYNNPRRQDIKIGKLINKIFPEKYDALSIEKFVNLYKSVIREGKTYFRLVNGKEIAKYYNEENTIKRGTIGNSCMRFDRCADYLAIYINNPDVIRLLVLFDDNDEDKAIGRSLIWNIKSKEFGDGIMMDRVYTSNDSDINIFRRYAIDNNIFMTKYDDENGVDKVYANLKPAKYKKYPYLDTLYIYQPSTGIISDTVNYMSNKYNVILLDDNYGGSRYHYKPIFI